MSETVSEACKWLEPVDCMSGERLTKRVYEFKVESGRGGRRPCTRWLDEVKKT